MAKWLTKLFATLSFLVMEWEHLQSPVMKGLQSKEQHAMITWKKEFFEAYIELDNTFVSPFLER